MELALTRYWIKRLLGGGVATPSVVSNYSSMRSGESTAGNSFSTLGASYTNPPTVARLASGQVHTNSAPIPEIVAIMGPYRTATETWDKHARTCFCQWRSRLLPRWCWDRGGRVWIMCIMESVSTQRVRIIIRRRHGGLQCRRRYWCDSRR